MRTTLKHAPFRQEPAPSEPKALELGQRKMNARVFETFVPEAGELLDQIEATTLALDRTPHDPELINQLFRSFHTLKGSAGVAGVTPIASFTHHVESAMEKVRSGAAVVPDLVSAVLAAKDHVSALLAELTTGAPCDPARGEAIVARLGQLTAHLSPTVVADEQEVLTLVEYMVAFTAIEGAEIDPGFASELATLGECKVLAPLPAWRAMVTTTRGENAVRDAFLFVQNLGELSIEAGLCMFVDEAPAPIADNKPTPAPLPRADTQASKKAGESTVRVPATRLDQLVKLVGELVIMQSRLAQAHLLRPTPEVAAPVEAMERLISDLRDGVLALRMTPVGTMFSRFQRLVRDLSAELGKEVELVTAGDDTELDKSVIDQVSEALVHILRNSLDHGLEAPDAREAAGKPRRGTLRLNATHEGTHVVITVTDDGRGIDTAAVRRKAEQQGLIAGGEALAEHEVIALIMRPGFSTASAITQVSGRGVGMDVVKKTIEQLRGSITITSQHGRGTEIRLLLPLTLAIIDGLLVEIHGDRYVVPMVAVTENLDLSAEERRGHNGRNAITVRGEMLPYIRLRELFALPDEDERLEKIVVVAVDGARVGLVVDQVIGQHQAVIQPLGRFSRGIDFFSGTTILADGRVAMILDLAGTLRTHSRAYPMKELPC